MKEVERVILKKGNGIRLTNQEAEIYESEPFFRDFDLTIQYLKSQNLLKADPTLADIERAHIQFYREQVDDAYGQKGKGKGKRLLGPIATTPI